MSRTVTAHCLIKNEARYLWFAVMSVIEHVDQVLLWDTGSTDITPDIIKEIFKHPKARGKVDFSQKGEVDPASFTNIRNEMLRHTDTDWFMILDGDEVWWEDSIKQLVDAIRTKGDKYDTLVSPYYSMVGDIYHYQSQSSGRYQIDDYSGHINIRAINRKLSGLYFAKPHGQQGLYLGDGRLIQDGPREKRLFINAPYLHFTNVLRSLDRSGDARVPKRKTKLKYDLGISFPSDFYYPEVFFRPRPDIIPSPWQKISLEYKIKSSILAPLRKAKNLIANKKVGY